MEFIYSAPSTVNEAVELLRDGGLDSRVLAGGTDLLIQLRAGARRAGRLVDVKRIPELNLLEVDERTGLRIGAAVPCALFAEHPVARRLYPGLVEAAALIGSTQIQSRATLAGNLCNASPAADTTPALIALDAVCVIAGPTGKREVRAAELATAPGKNVLAKGELLVEIRVAPPAPGSADAYQRMIPRNEMDIAIVGVGACVTITGGRCSAARIALGAVGPTVLSADGAAQGLVGTELDDASIARAAESARSIARPISDMRGPADYRREVTAVLVRRVVAEAARRARARVGGAA